MSPPSLRVLFVLPELSVGGTERQVLILARELKLAGHEALLLVLRPSQRPIHIPYDVETVTLPDLAAYSPRIFFQVLHQIRAFRPMVLHTFLFGFDFWVNLAGRMMGVPCVISSRRQLATWRLRRHLWWQNIGNLTVDAVIANSVAAAEYTYRTERFLNRGSIYSVPNAYELRVSETAPSPLPRKTGPGIVNIANFWPGKGQDALVRVFSHLRGQLDGASLWFVGDGPELEKVKDEAKALGVADAVHFPGQRHDIDRILGQADVYVHASDMESSPNAILEAMGAGVPVVAVACGGVPELLRGGELGLLAGKGDERGLERAILSVLDNIEAAATRVAAARRVVEEEHSPKGMAEAYIEVYRAAGRYECTSTEGKAHARTRTRESLPSRQRLRLGIYTIGNADTPSTWFRVFQFIPSLQRAGFVVEHLGLPATHGGRIGQFLGLVWQGLVRWPQLGKAKRYDVILVQKGLTPCRWRGMLEQLKAAGVPYVYDFDDAVHRAVPVTLPRALRRLQDDEEPIKLIRGARQVIAGNTNLAAAAKELCQGVSVVPTVVDTDRYWCGPRKPSSPIVIGWSGSSSTNIYVNSVLPVLKRVAENRPFRFLLTSDSLREIDHPALAGIDFEYVPWSREGEVENLRRMDIGVMPLEDNEWERAKCGAKALQYMAVGVPVVCSPVGVNIDIVRHGENGFLAKDPEEWYSTLMGLVGDTPLRVRMGREARNTVRQSYSVSAHGQAFAASIKNAMT